MLPFCGDEEDDTFETAEERSGKDALSDATAERVARFVGDSGVGVPGASKSRGWFLVATMLEVTDGSLTQSYRSASWH